MGFQSRNPNAMTNAERQAKFRRARGSRQLTSQLDAATAASVLYLRKEWGMTSNHEVAVAAIRFLALCTRQGLTRLPQSIDD
jgi:hypothetical protein